jgi:hypothetical protein
MRNNIKISFFQPEYIVDENNGVVICKLRFKMNAPKMCVLAAKTTKWGNPWCFYQVSKSVAFAKDTDKFDVNVGKRVSLAKAENQAYSYVYNLVNESKKKLLDATAACINFENKVKRVKEHNVEYMKKF